MKLKEFFFSILPPIRIHTWGGYGSQLYALYLSMVLQLKFPGRKVLIVAHTSGVTKRTFEIADNFELKFVQVDDFSDKTSWVTSSRSAASRGYRDLIRSSLEFSGFMSRCNTNFEIEKVRPWLLFVRGHYTHLIFEVQILKKMYDILSSQVTYEAGVQPSLCIQYRLGDLLHISNKTFTNPSAILEIISRSRLLNENLKIFVLSDSPKKAEEFLVGAGLEKKNSHFVEISPAETIIHGLNSTYFIGTTSKLSLWIAVLRSEISHKGNSFLPAGFEFEIESHKLKIPPSLY